MKKRVLIIGPPPSMDNTGGIAKGIQMLLESDLKSKYEFILLDEKKKGVKSSIFQKGKDQLKRLLRLQFTLVVNRVDLVHIKRGSVYQKHNLFWTLGQILISKLLLKKVVLQMHGSGFEDYCNGRDFWGNVLLRLIFMFSDRVIALCHYWKQNFKKIVRKEKVGIVPNGVIIKELESKEIARQNLNLPKSKIFVFFIGDLTREKGIYDIIKSIPVVVGKESNTLFACAGPSTKLGVEEEVNTICKEYKIDSYVKWLGPVWDKRKSDLFAASDIFILPSYAENMPNSILEAMAAGLPVVSTPVGGIPELIEESVNGFLVQPGDYVELGNKIVRLIEDEDLRKWMGQNNLKKVREKYDFSIVSAKLEREYENLTKSRHSTLKSTEEKSLK